MLNKSVKRLALFLIFVYLFLVKSGHTTADIFAQRIVSRNKLSAVTLDLSTMTSFNDGQKISLFNSSGFQPDGFDLNSIRIKGSTTGNFKYHIKVIKTGGDDLLCNKLELEVLNRQFSSKYKGALLNLNIDSNITNNNLDDWIFTINLNDNSQELKNKICKFDLDIKTYYDTPSETGGIFAEKLISNIISSGNW